MLSVHGKEGSAEAYRSPLVNMLIPYFITHCDLLPLTPVSTPPLASSSFRRISRPHLTLRRPLTNPTFSITPVSFLPALIDLRPPIILRCRCRCCYRLSLPLISSLITFFVNTSSKWVVCHIHLSKLKPRPISLLSRVSFIFLVFCWTSRDSTTDHFTSPL